jgi:hypothetical protein
MRLVSLPERSGEPNIHHFNFENQDGSMRHYTIGKEAVEIPDVDAKSILRLSEKVGAVEAGEQPEQRKTRRGKEAAEA